MLKELLAISEKSHGQPMAVPAAPTKVAPKAANSAVEAISATA